MSARVMGIEDVRYRVGAVTTLGWGREDELVKAILAAVVSRSEPIMRQRGWPVVRVAEFYPRSAGLQGMNTNHGELIQLRCRSHTNKSELLPYAHIMAVMLHELCHCAIGPHNAQFWALYKELVTQYESSEVTPEEIAVLKRLGQSGELEQQTATGMKAPRREGIPLSSFPGQGRSLGGGRGNGGSSSSAATPTMGGTPRFAVDTPAASEVRRRPLSKLIPPSSTSSRTPTVFLPTTAAAQAALRRYSMWKEAMTIYELDEIEGGGVTSHGNCGGACGALEQGIKSTSVDVADGEDEIEVVAVLPVREGALQVRGNNRTNNNVKEYPSVIDVDID